MHGGATVRDALALSARGVSPSEISRLIGVPRSTVRGWLAGSLPQSALGGVCERCNADHRLEDLDNHYVHLLGLYLGDGCISTNPRRVHRLRIFLDTRYPRLIDAAAVDASRLPSLRDQGSKERELRGARLSLEGMGMPPTSAWSRAEA
jgi:hypothetical protein